MVGKGDIVVFGSYPQNSEIISEKESIEWLVLDKKDDKILCVSKYLLDCRPYHERLEEITWEKSTLRKWLNEVFVLVAFTAEERMRILLSNVENPTQHTLDRIFLLSYDEAEEFLDLEHRAAKTTAYSRAQGAWLLQEDGANTELKENGTWWLRYYGEASEESEGEFDFMSCVNYDGVVEPAAESVNVSSCCVRPAVWFTEY